MMSKIGIFICDCNGSLRNRLDIDALHAHAAALPEVTHVEVQSLLCQENGRKALASAINSNGLERVVIAACSPILYETMFKQSLAEAGLNPCFLSQANIREQCAWALSDVAKATARAKALISAAVRRSQLQELVEEQQIPVSNEVLVVGGGIAGLSAAQHLVQLGHSVTLVEKEAGLGGLVEELAWVYQDSGAPQATISEAIEAVGAEPKANVLTSTELFELNGSTGQFKAKFKPAGATDQAPQDAGPFGAVVIATGFSTRFNTSELGFDGSKKITTLAEIERKLRAERLDKSLKTVAFMLDFANEDTKMMSGAALKTAAEVVEKSTADVFLFCRSMRVAAEGLEELYRDARERGVNVIKYDTTPQVEVSDAGVRIAVRDALLNQPMQLRPDLLVFSDHVMPSETARKLSEQLHVHTGPGNFFQDQNIHLVPVLSNRKGIFFIGGCRGPRDMTESIADAEAAAAQVHELLGRATLMMALDAAKVDPHKCAICLTCIRSCPHSAIEIDAEERAAKIIVEACQRCGICACECPAKAIEFPVYTDSMIEAELFAVT